MRQSARLCRLSSELIKFCVGLGGDGVKWMERVDGEGGWDCMGICSNMSVFVIVVDHLSFGYVSLVLSFVYVYTMH